jgi:uncharacterized membrane protein
MDVYGFVKFLHVGFVVIWLGGGLCLVLLAARANRADDTADLAKVIQQIVYMSGRVFVPSGLLALASGLIMAWLGDLFGTLWVIIGLVGFLATFGIGITLLKPRSDRVAAMIARDGITPAAIEQSREILRLAQFDMVLLFVIVSDMVIKPAPENFVVLLVMLAAILVGAGAFLRPVFASTAPRPA